MVKTLKLWLPVVLWMLVMYHFSSEPQTQASQVDWVDFVIKKAAHLSEYAILFVLSFRAFGDSRRSEKAFLLGLIFAFSDEIHQLYSPGRTASLRDVMLFDSVGLIIGWFGLWRVKKLEKWLTKL